MATKGSERIKWVADTRRQQRKEDGTDIGEGGRKEIFFFFLSFFRDSRSRFSCQIVFLAPFFSFLFWPAAAQTILDRATHGIVSTVNKRNGQREERSQSPNSPRHSDFGISRNVFFPPPPPAAALFTRGFVRPVWRLLARRKSETKFLSVPSWQDGTERNYINWELSSVGGGRSIELLHPSSRRKVSHDASSW